MFLRHETSVDHIMALRSLLIYNMPFIRPSGKYNFRPPSLDNIETQSTVHESQ